MKSIKHLRAMGRLSGFALAAVLLTAGSMAWAQSSAVAPRTSGYVATEADPVARAPRPDVAPVYRGPSEDTLAMVRQRGMLRVGVVPGEPMVIVNEQGELSGYSVDLARKLAEDLGVGVEFVQTSWPQVVPDLLAHQYDLVLSDFWVTMPRALVVNFTQPTALEGMYLVANQKSTGSWASVADFNKPGVRIAVDPATEQIQIAKRVFPRATLVTDAPVPLEEVRAGRAHATVFPTFAPGLLTEKSAGLFRLPAGNPLSTNLSAIAVRKGDADFLNLLNTWVNLQREGGWLDERAAYWSSRTGAP